MADLSTVAAAFERIGATLDGIVQRQADSVNDFLDARTNRRFETSRMQQQRRQLQLHKEESEAILETSSALKGFAVATKNAASITDDQQEMFREQLARVESSFGALEQALPESEFNILRSRLIDYTNGMDLSVTEMEQLSDILNDYEEEIDEAVIATLKLRKAQEKTKETLVGFQQAVRETLDQFFSLKAGIALTTAGVVRSMDEVEVAIARNVGMYSIMGTGLDETAKNFESAAMSIGLFPRTAQDMVAQNRLVIRSLGGVSKTFDGLAGQQDAIFDLFGSMEEGVPAMMDYIAMLKTSGASIDDVGNEIDQTAKSMEYLSFISGQSGAAIQQAIRSFREGAEEEAMLKMMDKKERNERVRSYTLMLQYGQSIGQNMQQTQQLFNSLRRTAQGTERDRMVRAARMQMGLAAAGVDGADINRARELMLKTTRTAQEDIDLQKILAPVADEIAQLRGSDIQANRVRADMLQRVFGEEISQMINEQNVSLTKGLQFDSKVAQKQFEMQQQQTSYLKDIYKFFDTVIRPTIGDPGLNIFGGIFATAGGFIKDIALLGLTIKSLGIAGTVAATKALVGAMTSAATTMTALVTGFLAITALGEQFLTGSNYIARFVERKWSDVYEFIGYSIDSIFKKIGSVFTGISNMFTGLLETIRKMVADSPIGKLFGLTVTPEQPVKTTFDPKTFIQQLPAYAKEKPRDIKLSEKRMKMIEEAQQMSIQQQARQMEVLLAQQKAAEDRNEQNWDQQNIDQIVQLRELIRRLVEISEESMEQTGEKLDTVAEVASYTQPRGAPSTATQ